MGLSIRIPGMKDTYDCGYISFGMFRMEVADAFNKEMGNLYRKWYKSALPFNPPLTDEEIKRYKETAQSGFGFTFISFGLRW